MSPASEWSKQHLCLIVPSHRSRLSVRRQGSTLSAAFSCTEIRLHTDMFFAPSVIRSSVKNQRIMFRFVKIRKVELELIVILMGPATGSTPFPPPTLFLFPCSSFLYVQFAHAYSVEIRLFIQKKASNENITDSVLSESNFEKEKKSNRCKST